MKDLSEMLMVLTSADCSLVQELDMMDFLLCKPDPVAMFGGDGFPMSLRTGAWLCPESCGCSQKDSAWCPKCSDDGDPDA